MRTGVVAGFLAVVLSVFGACSQTESTSELQFSADSALQCAGISVQQAQEILDQIQTLIETAQNTQSAPPEVTVTSIDIQQATIRGTVSMDVPNVGQTLANFTLSYRNAIGDPAFPVAGVEPGDTGNIELTFTGELEGTLTIALSFQSSTQFEVQGEGNLAQGNCSTSTTLQSLVFNLSQGNIPTGTLQVTATVGSENGTFTAAFDGTNEVVLNGTGGSVVLDLDTGDISDL